MAHELELLPETFARRICTATLSGPSLGMHRTPAQEAQALPPAVIEKIRSIPGNDKCVDCAAVEPA